MQKIQIAVVAFIVLTVACMGADERRILLIPLDPFEQKVSDKMRKQMTALETVGISSALQSWDTMAELPAWVFVEKEREIVYVFGRPAVSDDYRYAVISDRKKKLIIVRAGGIAGSYEIFVKPKKTDRSQKKT